MLPRGPRKKCVNCEKNSVVKMFSVQVDLRVNGISLEEANVAHASALASARPPNVHWHRCEASETELADS